MLYLPVKISNFNWLKVFRAVWYIEQRSTILCTTGLPNALYTFSTFVLLLFVSKAFFKKCVAIKFPLVGLELVCGGPTSFTISDKKFPTIRLYIVI